MLCISAWCCVEFRPYKPLIIISSLTFNFTTNYYLALLEAKQNRNQFPSLAESQLRILNVEQMINSKELINGTTVGRKWREAIEKQRRFAGYNVILFYAASNMDATTRNDYLARNISVILPNESNFDVDVAPTAIKR